MTELEGWKGCK